MNPKNFKAALIELGTTDEERAKTLGVSVPTLKNWKRRPPRVLQIVGRQPNLIRALERDYQAPSPSTTS